MEEGGERYGVGLGTDIPLLYFCCRFVFVPNILNTKFERKMSAIQYTNVTNLLSTVVQKV